MAFLLAAMMIAITLAYRFIPTNIFTMPSVTAVTGNVIDAKTANRLSLISGLDPISLDENLHHFICASGVGFFRCPVLAVPVGYIDLYIGRVGTGERSLT